MRYVYYYAKNRNTRKKWNNLNLGFPTASVNRGNRNFLPTFFDRRKSLGKTAVNDNYRGDVKKLSLHFFFKIWQTLFPSCCIEQKKDDQTWYDLQKWW